jgi:hypothetical protein
LVTEFLLSVIPLCALGAFILTPDTIQAAISDIPTPSNVRGYAQLQSIVITSAVTEGGLLGVCTRTVDSTTGRFRQESTLGIRSEAGGFDGSTIWSRDSAGLVQRDEGEFAMTAAVNQAYRCCMAYWFTDRIAAKSHSIGQRAVKDRLFDVISVEPNKGSSFELWFDAETHLLARSIEPGFYQSHITYFSDFRPVHGLLLPFSTRTSNGDVRFDRIEEVQGVQLNPKLNSQSFAMPKEGGPDFNFADAFPITIPFRLKSNLVVLEATINGREMPFVLDTGAVNLIFPETVKELGLTAEGHLSGFGGGQNEVTTSQVRVDALEFASTFYRPQIFMVYPFPTLRQVTGVPDLAGILGYEIFKRFVIRIDYRKQEVTFTLPDTYHYTGNGVIIPFHFVGNAIEVDGAINSIPSRLIVDTGTTGSLILYSPWVSNHRALFPNAFAATHTATGATGGDPVFAFAAIKLVTLGKYSVHDVTGALSLQTSGMTANPYSAGMVGAELFLKSAVILDYQRQRIILEGEHD